MVRIETLYQYLTDTYLQQFFNKYIITNQSTVSYQIVGFIVNLQLIQAQPNNYIYSLSVEVRTQFNRTNAGYNKIYQQIFSSIYSNLFNEDAPISGYNQIEAAMLVISMNISNDLVVPPVAAW